MAPIATSDLNPAEVSPGVMDPTVFPSPTADERLKTLWNLHGDPHSSKFSNPKLTSIAKLVEHNATVQPSQTAFIYPVGTSTTTATTPSQASFSILDWSLLHKRCCQAAIYYAAQFRQEFERAKETGTQPTIALLGTGNSIDYLITQIALNSLHLRVLLLSNKNAPDTRKHLIRVCNAAAIISDKANKASLLRQYGGQHENEQEHGYRQEQEACRLPVVDLVDLAYLEGEPQTTQEDIVTFAVDDEWNLQSMIIHSSGSTGLPKPVIHTNRSLCQIARMYRLLPEYYIENWYLCFPLFHVAGLSVALSGLPTGLPTTLPPEQWPPAPSSILSAWRALELLGHPADCLHCAPSVIEDLYEYLTLTSSRDYTPLTKLKVLQPGGAPLSPTILSKLQALGVNVKTTYGTSETGPPLRTIPHTRENPDVYRFRNLYPESPFVRMEPVGGGHHDGGQLFECVVYKGFPLAAELWLDDAAPNPYRTGDLFLQDPPASGYFVLQGRRDDILIHSNGEKTHASAVAMALEEDRKSVIAKTAVFGSGKPCPAVVVEVNWDAVRAKSQNEAAATTTTATHTDGLDLDDAVWRVVQGCNAKLATFSKIPRETMVILKKGETLPVTPKGNVRRNHAWELYEDRVDEAYNRFLAGDGHGPDLDNENIGSEKSIATSSNLTTTATTSKTQSRKHDSPTIEAIQRAVADVFGLPQQDITEDLNWYDLGLDSLKAVDLRSKLVRSFGGSRSFPLMFIFECPTARRLLDFLQGSTITTAKDDDDDDDDDLDKRRSEVTGKHHEWIRSAIHRMNAEIDQWKTTTPTATLAHNNDHNKKKTPEEVIYLTGASGSLGNALLEVMVQSPSVAKIYCAVRGRDPRARVVDSLVSRGYARDVYQSSKICAVPYDMGDERLGLDDAAYERLAEEVTIVMHNAWKLDFNQPVQQFEKDCLRGTMNLMFFSLQSPRPTNPKKFVFMSSVAAAMGSSSSRSSSNHTNKPDNTKVPERPLGPDPSLALPTGYAQSKFIIEQVAQHFAASHRTTIRSTHILRVGQLCGHSRSGAWNPTEMWPIMMMTALNLLSAMPLLQQPTLPVVVDWLPVDICAEAIHKSIVVMGEGGVVCRRRRHRLLDSEYTGTETATEEEEEKAESAESSSSSLTVTNLTNPSPTSWEELLDFLQQASSASSSDGRTIERIGMKEWVSRLEQAVVVAVDDGGETSTSDDQTEQQQQQQQHIHHVPALKLLGFFQAMADGAPNGEGVEFESAQVELGRKIDVVAVRKWLESWHKGGYLL